MKKSARSEQAERFRKAAKDLGADETGESFKRAFSKIVPPKRPPAKLGSVAVRRAKRPSEDR